jgi:hypothetical protein
MVTVDGRVEREFCTVRPIPARVRALPVIRRISDPPIWTDGRFLSPGEYLAQHAA